MGWQVCSNFELARDFIGRRRTSERNGTVCEYLTCTWKYFKRMDVLHLKARSSRGTNGE